MTRLEAQGLFLRIQSATDADWEPVKIARTGPDYEVWVRDRHGDGRLWPLIAAQLWDEHVAVLAAYWNAVAAHLGLSVRAGGVR